MILNRTEQELGFLMVLDSLHKKYNADWVQTKRIAEVFFGASISKREEQTKKMRVHRIGDRLEKQGLVHIKYRRENVGKSTGKSKVKYFKLEEDEYEKLK